MTNTKRALFTSALSLLICIVMLMGTTFAWFTDSVTSGKNLIAAGNLDVELEYWNGEAWADVAGETELFTDELWEPGHTETLYFRIANRGSLALKYSFAINILAETGSVNKEGEPFLLSDHIMFGVVDGVNGETDAYGTRTDAVAALDDAKPISTGYSTEKELLPDSADDHAALVVYMPETVGNEANHRTDATQPKILLGVTLIAKQLPHEWDSFDNTYDNGAQYPELPTTVNAVNLASIDFTGENKVFAFAGDFDDVKIDELGEGSVLDLGGANIASLDLGDDATIIGGDGDNKTVIGKMTVGRNGTEPIELNLDGVYLDVEGELSVSNTDGESILNITDSNISFGTIFVGGHSMLNPNAKAQFNVIDSYISGEENGLGSTIAIWGQNGVESLISNSEVYTYSRGWHQSEDANDNSITFQSGTSFDIEIKNSNMHLYGARSIINVRDYGNSVTDKKVTIDNSLIWVVTKSSHGDTTLPVWGATEITDTALLFTKNVYNSSSEAVYTGFVYGNPVIHGDYHVTTQCNWATDILLENQTVTLAENANLSVYDGAAEVNFVLAEGAKVVIENGAKLDGIGVKAADGYMLETATANGVTTYSVK